MALVHALAKIYICHIIIKSYYFQNAQKGECLLDDFEALVREIDVHYYEVAKCHFEGSDFKNMYIMYIFVIRS
jgi:hypothetical protein